MNIHKYMNTCVRMGAHTHTQTHTHPIPTKALYLFLFSADPKCSYSPKSSIEVIWSSWCSAVLDSSAEQ